MTPQVRPGVAEDAGQLAAIDAESSLSPWSVSQFHSACSGRPGEFVLVAFSGGEVLGFVVGQRVLDEVSVHNVAVTHRARRSGIGRCLLQRLLETQPGDVTRCLLEVRASNHAARALYTSLGFSEDGRRPGYYPGPAGREDAVLMSLAMAGEKQ